MDKQVTLNKSAEVKESKVNASLPSPNYEAKFLLVGSDNFTDQYVCQTNDNLDVGNWASIPDIYDSFTMFPVLTAGAAIYFGGTTNTMAFQINITTATSQSSNLVIEYWNGTVWTAINSMSMLATKPFYTYANALFGRTQSERVYIGLTNGWVQNTLNGLTYYWFRVRITSDLSTNIVGEAMVRVIPALEVDAAGYIHQSGLVTSSLPIALRGTAIPLANVFPGDFPVAALNYVKASNGNANICTGVLRGIDTSKPIKLNLSWFSPSAGNLKLSISSMPVVIGQTMSTSAQSTPPTENTTTVVVTNTPGTYMFTSVSIPINNMILKNANGSTDILAIGVMRLSNDVQDTINDSVYLFAATLSFFAVSLGLQSSFY